MFLHVVKKGDNLYDIAKQYHTDIEKIIYENDIDDPNRLVVGQSLIISPDNYDYVIKENDTLEKIAKSNHLPIEQILNFNSQIKDSNNIKVGDTIKIVFSNYSKKAMEVNGFTYIDIDPKLLRQALPHLTYLSIFSYHLLEDGTLEGLNDEKLIKEAYKYKVAPLMVVTNINEDSDFDSDLASSVLENVIIQEKLIGNIYETIKNKGFMGVNIDFEYLYPQDREAYNTFLIALTKKLNPEGFIVITSLAPKTEEEQEGLLYEAHDYAQHNKIVNRIILMTYEWGYIYGPEMPVSPLDKVEEVIQYAVSVIDSKKILMGIPNYGYDFTLPFVQGQVATVISNPEAIKIALKKNASIKYDGKRASPYIVYYENNKEHNVYFEDARSIIEKIILAEDYDLGGISYWNIMNKFTQNWRIIDYYIDVIKII